MGLARNWTRASDNGEAVSKSQTTTTTGGLSGGFPFSGRPHQRNVRAHCGIYRRGSRERRSWRTRSSVSIGLMNMNLMYGKCACKCVSALMEKENNGQ